MPPVRLGLGYGQGQKSFSDRDSPVGWNPGVYSPPSWGKAPPRVAWHMGDGGRLDSTGIANSWVLRLGRLNSLPCRAALRQAGR